ncbi:MULTISPECIES: MFS transporter [unclassified Streptomyces]|uniref:MFS transporter n=1 Tax=unclassified Streptomyces TaxID=2593676 RepID=UPI00137227EF|nr:MULTISPECIES: MFS transporter [unclassified Streptomyces]NEA06455.1 MFS transporter [Streptomyces sp. SID10116]MYY82746.1 MFS transporter [Streptomyces sp. SID335]MYZ15511.1 MFS transporter [Streptomyces sp. SID337]MYZ17995.1 MFS transporter [Streptomyces sp. SID337]NDZ87945.1 MFS transporter [Streptomyces sp. SID10115]
MATDTTTAPSPQAAPPAPPHAAKLSTRDKLVLFVLCAAQFMVALDFSVLNVALPVLGPDLGMSHSALQWAVTAFALPSGGFLLLFGRTGDLFGRRKLFLAGLALFGLASLLATFAWDPASFLAGRALQGVGAAAIVPTGMSLLTTTFPEGPQRDRALGISGTLLSLGFTVGMVLGGVLTDTLGWRSTMGLLTLFALIVLPLAPGLLPESRTPDRPRLDVPGAVTVTGGLLSLIYALSTAAQRGFGGTDVIATLVAGVLLLALFGHVESRAESPLVSLPMLRRRTVAWGNLGGLVTFSMMSTVVFVLTLYFQEVLRLSAFATGLIFGVQGVLSVVAGVYAPRIIGRFGARRTLVGSLVGQGLLGAALLGVGEGGWSVWLATAAVSVASMFHLGAIVSYGVTVTSGVPDEEQGLATGLVTSTQQVGLTVGIPVLGVLATTGPDLLTGTRTVLAIDAAVVLATAAAVAVGLGGRERA